jgi:hypothetical protein
MQPLKTIISFKPELPPEVSWFVCSASGYSVLAVLNFLITAPPVDIGTGQEEKQQLFRDS